jgi:hypothetical protein
VSYNLISALFYRLFLTAVIMFGIGYYIVSRNLTLNRAVVWLGLVSKLILFAVFTVLFFIDKATLLAFLALCGDAAWSLLFILFLWQTKVRAGC